MAVDANPDAMGQFWLTGSQQFELMKNVGESLAGRVALLPLGGITQGEENGAAVQKPFSFLETPPNSFAQFEGVREVFARIYRGTYPALVSGRVKDVQTFYRSYVATYVERDVRQMTNVADTVRFLQFLKVMASRVGGLLNLSDVARDVGISQPTAKAWLSILEASGLVYLLRPYKTNIASRLVKTPKVYFMDTGLCCYLTGWTSAATACEGAMSGALLENYVVSELVRSFWNVGEEVPLYFIEISAALRLMLFMSEMGCSILSRLRRRRAPRSRM